MPSAEAAVRRLRTGSQRAAAVAGTFTPRPAVVLPVLLVVQWAVVMRVANLARHNGWLFLDGGDGTWYSTTSWVLAQGHIPRASIGFVYSTVLAPLAAIVGPNRLDTLPFVVAFNLLVLLPVALLCVYGIASQIAGRRFGYAAAALWVVFPLLSLPYFYPLFRSTYEDVVLPPAAGLTTNGDFPSMVVLLVAAYFVVRAIGRPSLRDAVAAGLAAGVAVGLKPANALFLPAVLAALALARRPRELVAFGGAVLPAVLALALWKYRGLGNLPVLTPTASSAAGLDALPVPSFNPGRYIDLDWDRFWRNVDGFREYAWSRRMLQWLLIAGAIGLGRRSLPIATLMAGWLAAFLVAKGASPLFSFGDGGLLTHLIAAFPAVFLLIVSVPLLVPRFGQRLAEQGRQAVPSAPSRAAPYAIGIGATLAVVPLALFALLKPLDEARAVTITPLTQYIPADAFTVSASRTSSGAVRLSWGDQRGGGADVGYSVFREPADPVRCIPADGAAECELSAGPHANTTATTYDDRPPPGHWIYRVAVRTAPWGPVAHGDFVMLSRAVEVDVR